MKKGEMEIKYVDPNALKIPAVRITSMFDDEIRQMFSDDIAKTGIEQPLIVAREGTDLWVIDGLNRREEALLKGMKEIPCVIRDMSLKDIQLRNLVSNRLRGRTKASEEVMVIKDLNENHGCGIEEIVDRTGMRRERVEQLLQIGGVDLEVWEALDQERIKVCQAFQISRLVDRSAQLKMLRVIEQYHLTCDTLKEAVDEALKIVAERKTEETGNTVVQPPEIPTATCTVCKQKYPVRELSAPVLCRNCFATLIAAYNQALSELNAEREKTRALAEGVVKDEEKTGLGL